MISCSLNGLRLLSLSTLLVRRVWQDLFKSLTRGQWSLVGPLQWSSFNLMGLSSLPRAIFPKCDLQILGDSLNLQRVNFLSLSDLHQQFQIFLKGDQPISWRFSQANKG